MLMLNQCSLHVGRSDLSDMTHDREKDRKGVVTTAGCRAGKRPLILHVVRAGDQAIGV